MDWLVYVVLWIPHTLFTTLFGATALAALRIPAEAWSVINQILDPILYLLHFPGDYYWEAVTFTVPTYLAALILVTSWRAGWKLKQGLTAKAVYDAGAAKTPPTV